MPRFGGDSESNSNQETFNTDARVVGGDNSSNISAHNSTITMVDGGVVDAAFGFSEKMAAGAFEMASASQARTAETVSAALGQVATAYEDAKNGEKQLLTTAVLSVVGIVAAIALKG